MSSKGRRLLETGLPLLLMIVLLVCFGIPAEGFSVSSNAVRSVDGWRRHRNFKETQGPQLQMAAASEELGALEGLGDVKASEAGRVPSRSKRKRKKQNEVGRSKSRRGVLGFLSRRTAAFLTYFGFRRRALADEEGDEEANLSPGERRRRKRKSDPTKDLTSKEFKPDVAQGTRYTASRMAGLREMRNALLNTDWDGVDELFNYHMVSNNDEVKRLIEALRIRPDLYDARFLDDLRTLRNDMDDISKTFFDAKQKKNANAADMWIKEYMRKLQRFSIACGWTKETDWTVEGKLKNEREVLGLDE